MNKTPPFSIDIERLTITNPEKILSIYNLEWDNQHTILKTIQGKIFLKRNKGLELEILKNLEEKHKKMAEEHKK